MAELTSKQRPRLRSEVHALEPILRIGKEGVTDEVARSAPEALANRELQGEGAEGTRLPFSARKRKPGLAFPGHVENPPSAPT